MTVLTARHIRRPQAFGILAAAALIVVASYVPVAFGPASEGSAPPAAAPEARPSDGSAGTSLEAGGESRPSLQLIDHNIDLWSRNLAANPSDYLAATNIAILYAGRARLSSDLRDQERALEAARTALSIAPTHAPARATEAAILHSLHDFNAAFEAADALLRDEPTHVGALATRFDAGLELGRIEDARRDLTQLGTVGGPAVLIREARLRSVTGDAGGALERAIAAERAAVSDEGDDPGFYAYAVGEYARLAGDAITARAAFTRALAIRPGDVGALIGLARIDAFDGRTDDAIEGLRRATAIVPQPESLALLGDLLAERSGTGAEATDAFETVRFIARLGDVQAVAYDRQLLVFELDHGGASEELLARARRSLAQRPDAAGHDTLAWAQYRLGYLGEAADSIAAARALGADDARLRFHDGAIRLAQGDVEAGLGLLRSALALGPALDPIERAEAEGLIGG